MNADIDYTFVVRVKTLMEHLLLPTPRKTGTLRNDDEILPIITGGYWKC